MLFVAARGAPSTTKGETASTWPGNCCTGASSCESASPASSARFHESEPVLERMHVDQVILDGHRKPPNSSLTNRCVPTDAAPSFELLCRVRAPALWQLDPGSGYRRRVGTCPTARRVHRRRPAVEGGAPGSSPSSPRAPDPERSSEHAILTPQSSRSPGARQRT